MRLIELGVPPLTERSWDSKCFHWFTLLCLYSFAGVCGFGGVSSLGGGYMGVDDVVFVLKSKGGDGCEYRFRNAECALSL